MVHIITQMGRLLFPDSPTFMGGGELTLHLLCQQYEKYFICHKGPVNIGYWLKNCVKKDADAAGGLPPIVGNFTPKLRGFNRSFCLLLLICARKLANCPLAKKIFEIRLLKFSIAARVHLDAHHGATKEYFNLA